MLSAQRFHVEIAIGFNPILRDLDRESANEPQTALLVGKNADHMSAALSLLIEPLKHIGALEAFVTHSGQQVQVIASSCSLRAITEAWRVFLPARSSQAASFFALAPIARSA
jgi:hypothetical protein